MLPAMATPSARPSSGKQAERPGSFEIDDQFLVPSRRFVCLKLNHSLVLSSGMRAQRALSIKLSPVMTTATEEEKK